MSTARARLGAALRASAKVVALFVTFVVALVIALALHIDSHAARRIAITQTNLVLARAFEGSVRIDRLSGLSLGGVRAAHVLVDDEGGTRVVDADGIAARIDTWRLLRSLASPSGPIDVRVSGVAVTSIDASLATSDSGGLRIAHAFALRPKAPAAPNAPHARAVRLDLDVVSIGLHVREAPRDIKLHADVRGHVGVDGGVVRANVALSGEASHVPVTADAAIDGDRVDATLTVGVVDAEKLQPILRELALHGKLTASAAAHGTLSNLDLSLRAALNDALVSASARIVRDEDTHVTCNVDIGQLDASVFSLDAPVTSIDANASAAFTRKANGAIIGDARLVVPRATVGANAVPPITLIIQGDDQALTATLLVDEPGARTDATLSATRVDEKIAFEVTTHAPDLANVPRLAGRARGRVDVHAKGAMTIDPPQVDATVDVDAISIATPLVRVARARLDARVFGAIANPSVDGKLVVSALAAGGMNVPRGTVRVTGPARRPKISAVVEGPSATHLEAGAEVAMALPIDVRNAYFRATRGDVRIDARVGEVRIDGSDIRITDAVVDGLGRPAKLGLDKRGASLHVVVDAPRLDLGRLAAFSRSTFPIAGRLDAQADVTLTNGAARGKIALDARRVRVRDISDIRAHVDAIMDGHRVSGIASVTIPGVVEVRASAPDLTAAGDVTREVSWTHATGHAQVAGEVVLDRILALLPEGKVPLTELRGALAVSASLDRGAHDTEPSVVFAASTRGLVVAQPKWRSADVDVDVVGHVDPNDDSVNAVTTLRDGVGTLLIASASTKLSDLRNPNFERVPLHARFEIPSRDLQTLPVLIRPGKARGSALALIDFDGTLLKPAITIGAHVQRLAVLPDSDGVDPTDVLVNAHYDGVIAAIDVIARGLHGQSVHTIASVDVRADDILHMQSIDTLSWNGSARAILAGFKIQSIPAAADLHISGNVEGELVIDDLHTDARARLSLDINRIRIGRVRNANATIRATIDDNTVGVLATLNHGDGSATVDVHSAMHWGAAIVPRLDVSQAAQIAVHARALRMALVAPFAGDAFRDMEGRLSADLSGTLGPIGSPPTIEGTVELKDGSVNVPAFGQELQGITARLVITHAGDVTLDRASAHALGGEVDASGHAKLSGFSFAHADATVSIDEKTPVPVTIDGEPLGSVWGHVDMKADKTAAAIVASVSVPSLHVTMPDQTRSAAQSLTAAKDIRIGVRRADGTLTPISGDVPPVVASHASLPIRVSIRFGSDVEIRRGAMLRVGLRGGPDIELADKLRVSGQMQLVNGTIDVQGKRFAFDEGSVAFVGDDPTNPTLNVSASWDAPEGTRVIAMFVGPLKTGTMTLTSEPTLSQSEILSLILFGTTDGMQGQGASQSTPGSAALGAGAGVGAGFATQGVNKAISQLTTIDVSTRVDTSHDAPRPEIVVQLTKDISAQFAYVLGTPPVGQNPDQTLLTINWRFLGNWSLETTVGDAGSSIMDVLWKKRY